MSPRPLVLLLTLLLPGCAGPTASPGNPSASAARSPGATDVAEASAEATAEASATEEALYSCFSAPHPASAWDGTRPATELEGHAGYDVLVESVGPDGLEGWFVLEEADDRLVVARELTQPQDPDDDILRTHDLISVRDVDAPNAQGWMLDQATQCAPQRVLDGLGEAQVWLAAEPDPSATTIDLLIVEMACNSGEDAEGRVRVVEQSEATDAVELLVAVEPRGGDASCPSNPATPLTVELAEPLGDRALVDTSVYPPRPLEMAPDGIWLGD